MSTISAVSTATQTTTDSTSTTQTLDQTDFINLLITEMKYQDPLEPLDNYQMASQMAQFSTVQLLTTISDSISSLAASQAEVNNLQASTMLGKKVEIQGNEMSIEGETASGGYYQLSTSGEVSITIYDSDGNSVRTIEAGTQDTSKQEIAWDGKDDNGNLLSDGRYTFKVSATDSSGQDISVTTYCTGLVTGISFEEGTTYLTVGDQKTALSDIIAILG